ncbi:MAG: antitoxin [Candidatus Nanopelagicales bacterium]
MAAISVRNLSDETHRGLKARAAVHGRSTEAEIRKILDEAASGYAGEGLGTRITQIASEVGGFELEVSRSDSMTEPIDFS